MDISTVDFSKYGVSWRVRQGLVTRDFSTLADLQEALDEGTVDLSDDLSPDGRSWVRIDSIASLELHFSELLDRVESGEMIDATDASFIIGDEGDEDAPTTIVRTNSINLDLPDPDLDEEDHDAPPPAVPTFEPVSDDMDTEAVEAEAASTPSVRPAPAIVSTHSGPPVEQKRSVVPIVLLVLVIIAVLGLMLYSPGLFAAAQG